MAGIKRVSLLLTASVVAVAMAPIGAFAQTSDEASDEIVVRGIKKSLEDAAAAKRNSPQIVDAISAEDIGALADQNIADSLQRVSGVQIRRSGAGEGDSVDIRGFSQNRYEINGRTLSEFNGRSSDASRDDGQQSLLGIIPSELVGRIEVFKLLSADQIEGSQGGTVNIITRKPLDKPGLQVAGSVEGSYADLSKKLGYGASGLISNTFANDTFGVLVNFSVDERQVAEDRFFSFNGWIPISAGNGSNPAQVAFADPNGDGVPSFRIRDLRFQRTEALRRRLGGSATIQWEPTDSLSTYADVLYARQFSNEMRQWFAVGTSGNAADYSDYFFSENDSLLAGTLAQQLEGNVNTNPDNVFQSLSGAVGGKWTSGRLTLSGEASLAKASADIRQQFIRVRSNDFVDVSFDFRTDDLPSLILPSTLNGADIFDLSQYNISNVFDRVRKRNTDELTGRFDI
ncbi:MAG: TonB-dependent receptor plug domain-containing protein, partial [Amphiplicatus sp.]